MKCKGRVRRGRECVCMCPPPHLPPLAWVHTRASTCSPVCLSCLVCAVGDHSPAVGVCELGKRSLRTFPCECAQASTSGAKSPPIAVTPNHQMGKVKPWRRGKQPPPTPQAGQVHQRLWLLNSCFHWRVPPEHFGALS